MAEGEKKNKKNEGSKGNEAQKTPLDELLQGGDATVKRDGETFHFLSIIGLIEGHTGAGETQKTTKYEHVIPLLAAIEQSDEIDGLLILLNTIGGDVEAGLAIAEMIASMKKPTVSLVLGGGHSIGVPLAVAAKKSFIVPSATMTIHPVRISGTVIGVPQTFRYFADMQKRITAFICRNSRADADTITRLMMNPDDLANDVGTLLDGHEAVKHGIIDQVGGLSDALAALREMVKEI